MTNSFATATELITNGKHDALQVLLEAEPALASQRSAHPHQATLLHYLMGNGLESGHQSTPPNAVSIAELLFSHGAEADAPSNLYPSDGQNTPMEMLVTSAFPYQAKVQVPLIECLVDNGASPNGPGNDGMPLGMALAAGFTDAGTCLANMGARVDSLILAAALGDLDFVETCYEKGMLKEVHQVVPTASTNREGRFSWPLPPGKNVEELAFVFACLHGQIAIIDWFLDRGVNIDCAPLCHQTGLHYAAYAGHLDVIRRLLSQGANPAAVEDQFSNTPLDWANENGNREAAQVMEQSRQ